MYREESDSSSYNGWMFYGFDEDAEYLENADNFCLYSTHGLAERFPNMLHSPAGTAYFGNKDGTLEIDEREG